MQPADPLAGAARPGISRPGAAEAILLEPRLQVSRLAVGDEVTARLLSDRASGRFSALIEGRSVEIALPRGARAGDSVTLLVAATEPRLVLVPRSEAAALAGAGSGSVPASLPAGVPASAVAAPVARPEVAASAPAQALARLLGELGSLAARARGEAPATAGVPLLAAPGTAPLAPQLAAALARSFSGSGLFYESHQAQWVAGTRSLESLQSEPQGRLPPLPGRAEAGAAPVPAAPASRAAEPLPVAAPARDPAAPAGAASTTLATRIDPAAAPLIEQQLSALDQRMAVWAGPVLPGMQLGMTVHERIEREPSPGAATDAAEWATQLEVTLPQLGAVRAQIVLRGDRVQLQVDADEAAGLAKLHSGRAELLDALAAAGLQVEALRFAPGT